MSDESNILILFGLGYLMYKFKLGKKITESVSQVTGSAHEELGIQRVMGGPGGFIGTSQAWPRFFPPISQWGNLE